MGIVLLGIFSTLSVNPAGADGLLNGGVAFFGKQLAAVTFASVYAFAVTLGIFFLLGKTMSLRTSEKVETQGLDGELHGETAYGPETA